MSWNRDRVDQIDIWLRPLTQPLTATSPVPSLPPLRPRHVCPTQIASDECRTSHGVRVPAASTRVRRRPSPTPDRHRRVCPSGADALKLQPPSLALSLALTRRARRKDPSGGSHISRSGTPLSFQGQGHEQGSYYDDEDVFDDYTHERLPTEPARIDLELPESNLDLTMTFQSILAEAAPAEPAQECVFLPVLARC